MAAHLHRTDTPLKLAMVTGDEPPRIVITGTARARRGGGTADIPARRFTLTPGTPRLVTVRLPRAARHVLAHGDTVRLRLRATDPAGNVRVTRFTFG